MLPLILHRDYNLIKKRLTGLTNSSLRCTIIYRILQRGETVYEKNPEAVYAYYLNIELDCGGYVSGYPALAESVNSGQAPYEIDISRSDNYLNVYDMNGYPLAVFTYKNEMTFYTSMPSQDETHTGDEIVFFDNPIPEIDEDSAVSMKYSGMGLEVDERNRTVTDKGSGICYCFDFENRIASAQ